MNKGSLKDLKNQQSKLLKNSHQASTSIDLQKKLEQYDEQSLAESKSSKLDQQLPVPWSNKAERAFKDLYMHPAGEYVNQSKKIDMVK